ncbi:MAG TPA: tetratricopeptide repeat protein [Pyrinomonadaceae bacterium]|nr:tetratricopeptide repeat protein [Pyrinomonadaceae bacterium]
MKSNYQINFLAIFWLFICGLVAIAQDRPLTYPEIMTALNNKIPNKTFKTKKQVVDFLIEQVKQRGVKEELSKKMSVTLSEAGATEDLITEIIKNSGKQSSTALAESEDYAFYIKRGDKFVESDSESSQKLMDLAVADYTKAIELNPKSAEAYYKRAKCYRVLFTRGTLSNWKLVFIDLNKVIELNPTFAEAYLERGNFYQGQISVKPNEKEYDTALSDFNKVIELNHSNQIVAMAYRNRGSLYNNRARKSAENKEYDLAIADFTKAIDDYTKAIKPDNDHFSDIFLLLVFESRGKAYFDKKEYDLAINDFTKAIDLYTKAIKSGSLRDESFLLSRSYSERGLAYESKKDYKLAIADYQKATQLNPNNKEAKEALARILKLVNP